MSGLLGHATYDPASAATIATTAAAAMADIDATNLAVTFTAPASGTVLIRIRVTVHGSTSNPQILLGVREGSSLLARVAPMVGCWNANSTQMVTREAMIVLTGISAGSHTYKAAFGVETAFASTGIKHGGPDNSTTDNAFGASIFEVWDGSGCLGAVNYDPGTAVTKSGTASGGMTDMDATNVAITFTVPTTGIILWRIKTLMHGSGTFGQFLLGIRESSTVRARAAPMISRPDNSAGAANLMAIEASGVISGLTPSATLTYKAAYGVETVSGAGGLKWGGPDDASANNAFGAVQFEIWGA